MQTTRWCTSLGVLERDDDRRLPRIETELERRCARVGEQAPLELGIHPRAGDEPCPVGGRTGDEPVDPLAHLGPVDDALLDQQLLERPRTRSRLRLGAVGDRRVVVVVLVVVSWSLIRPPASARRDRCTPGPSRCRDRRAGVALRKADQVERLLRQPVLAVGSRLRVRERPVRAHDLAGPALGVGGRPVMTVVRPGRDPHPLADGVPHAPSLASISPSASTPFSVRISSIE